MKVKSLWVTCYLIQIFSSNPINEMMMVYRVAGEIWGYWPLLYILLQGPLKLYLKEFQCPHATEDKRHLLYNFVKLSWIRFRPFCSLGQPDLYHSSKILHHKPNSIYTEIKAEPPDNQYLMPVCGLEVYWKRQRKELTKLVLKQMVSGLFMCYQFLCRALQHTLHLFKGPVSHASVEKSPEDHTLLLSLLSAPSTLYPSPSLLQVPTLTSFVVASLGFQGPHVCWCKN